MLMSLSSPFLFKLWSVQAMDTCIAPAVPRPGGGRTHGPPRAAAAQHGRQTSDLGLPEHRGLRQSRAACPRCRRQRNANLPRQRRERLRAHSGLSAAMLLLSQKHPSSQVLPERRSFMVIAPQPLCLAAGSRPLVLNHCGHPASAGSGAAGPRSAEQAQPSPVPRQRVPKERQHPSVSFAQAQQRYLPPMAARRALAAAPQRPRDPPARACGEDGKDANDGPPLCSEGRQAIQADPPGKIAAGIAKRGLL